MLQHSHRETWREDQIEQRDGASDLGSGIVIERGCHRSEKHGKDWPFDTQEQLGVIERA